MCSGMRCKQMRRLYESDTNCEDQTVRDDMGEYPGGCFFCGKVWCIWEWGRGPLRDAIITH